MVVAMAVPGEEAELLLLEEELVGMLLVQWAVAVAVAVMQLSKEAVPF